MSVTAAAVALAVRQPEPVQVRAFGEQVESSTTSSASTSSTTTTTTSHPVTSTTASSRAATTTTAVRRFSRLPGTHEGAACETTTYPAREDRQIAFVRELGGGDSDVFLAQGDGSDLFRATMFRDAERFPVWQPEAFLAYHDGAQLIYQPSSGSGPQPLGPSDLDIEGRLAWSPAGLHLAFSNRGQIWTIAPDGSDLKPLTSVASGAVNPSWSPDGCFVLFETADHRLWIVQRDGSGLARLGFRGRSPDWGPDGRIVYESPTDQQIHVAHRDGTGDVKLTHGPGPSTRPSWSETGRRILFESARDGNPEIYTMATDGSGVRRITNDPAPDVEASW